MGTSRNADRISRPPRRERALVPALRAILLTLDLVGFLRRRFVIDRRRRLLLILTIPPEFAYNRFELDRRLEGLRRFFAAFTAVRFFVVRFADLRFRREFNNNISLILLCPPF